MKKVTTEGNLRCLKSTQGALKNLFVQFNKHSFIAESCSIGKELRLADLDENPDIFFISNLVRKRIINYLDFNSKSNLQTLTKLFSHEWIIMVHEWVQNKPRRQIWLCNSWSFIRTAQIKLKNVLQPFNPHSQKEENNKTIESSETIYRIVS